MRNFAEGVMRDPSVWSDLEARFKALRLEDGDQLQANWISTAWNLAGAPWYLSGNLNPCVHYRFELLAERGAVELGHEDHQSSLFFWLDLLKADSPTFRDDIQISGYDSDGKLHTSKSGVIERV